jgi:hypothetical protein
MTTAMHTQGLQAMYPSAQQYAIAGSQPQFGFSPTPYGQAYGPTQYHLPQQFGAVGSWYGTVNSAPYGTSVHQQVAFELFRLAQIVQSSGQLVGPQPGKPSRPLIAAELFRLAQTVQSSGQHAQQFQMPFGTSNQFPAQAPVWS